MNVIVSRSVIVVVSLPGAIENNFIRGLFWLVYDHDNFLDLGLLRITNSRFMVVLVLWSCLE